MKAHKKARLLFVLIIVVMAGGWFIFGRNDIKKLDYPEYLSFQGNYVFSVPKNYVVDEQSIQGLQLVYSGTIYGKTLDNIYADNNISLQPLPFLKDKKGDDFKKYINETLVPQQKQELSPNTAAAFTKNDGWDEAKLTIKKDGQPLRFMYIKTGLHPVSIVSKQETDPFKKIEQSITDVEKTDLKNEAGPLKKAVQNTAQLLRDKNAAELYKQAAPEFRSKNTQDDVSKLLAVEEVFTQGAEVINGGSYDGNVFGGIINFTPLNKDFRPAQGALYYQKIDGQWKLKGIQLPNPAVYKIQN